MDMGMYLVCRLCLRAPEREVMLIDETVRQMLKVLLVKMNFDVSNDPLMCSECTEIMERSLSFILVCLESEKIILLFEISENKINIDLIDVFACNSKEILDIDDNICLFCIQKIEGKNFIPLDVLMKENVFSDMVKKYMFQMDPNMIKNPLVCFHCRDNIESYYTFLRNCCNTEAKINTYLQNKSISIGEKINLINVTETFFVPEKNEEICSSVIGIKKEFDKENEGVLNAAAPDTKNMKIETVSSQTNNQMVKIGVEELIIKDEITSNESVVHQRKVHETCICKTKRNKCDKCKSRFEIVSTTSKVYKCKLCSYQGGLKSHMLQHRDESGIQNFKSYSCPFGTKHRKSLKSRLPIHKDISEVQIYRCYSCKFETKYKNNLRKHVFTHKESVHVQMYQCDNCQFQTRYKWSLKKHSLIHKDIPEVPVYRCDRCEYQTIRKKRLTNHQLIHRDFSKVQVYQCSSCNFEAKSMATLKYHVLTHKDYPELQMLKCQFCNFQTEVGSVLKRHSLTHKITSDLKLYECAICGYKTIQKISLDCHLSIHQSKKR